MLEKESLAISGVAGPFELTWFYTARGDVSSLTYPSTHNVSFNPNAYGEPRQVGSYATNASYHPYGGLAGFTYGNSTTRTITPNARQLPQQIVDTRAGTPWLDHALAYDPNGNLTSLTDGVVDPDGQPSESRTLTYDQRDRLTGVTGAASGNETYGYDVLDNVRRTIIGGVDRRFAFSPATNRLSQVTAVGSPVVMDYAWNPRGELTSRTKTTPGSLGVTPPRVFQNGFEENVITATETFGFDQARRLTTFLGIVTHQYDAHQRRVSTTVPGWGTRYQIYSRAGELLYVQDAGADERTEFFHLTGTLVAERTRPLLDETTTVSYLHSDHRGTPTVKTSSAGTRTYRSRLQPYGTPYDGIYREGPGFTKHATDETSSMSYMQQRYYDPNMPGFISPDPVGASADGFNRYVYARNNPYTYVDPDGRDSGAFYTQDHYRMAPPSSQHLGLFVDFTPVIGDIKGFVDAYNEPSAINFIAAAIGVVPGVGDAAGKAIKAGSNIAQNAAKGAKAEAAVAATLGDAVAGQRVTLEASTGQRSVADIVTKDRSVIEVKTGSARLSPGQQAVKADIDAGRMVIPRGANADKAGLNPNQPTQMKCYDVTRC